MQTIRLKLLGSLFVVLLGFAGCGEGAITYMPISDGSADAGADGDKGGSGGAGGTGGGTSNLCTPACDGECAPLPPPGFSHPFLFAIGSQPVACPDTANLNTTTRFADIDVPPAVCAACACAPSTGDCSEPTTITAHAADCDHAEGSIATPTNPPASWNGACAADNALPSGITCAGKSCVQSITVGPMGIANETCNAYSPGLLDDSIPSPSWKTYATECQGIAAGVCDAALCVPGRTEGFDVCIEQAGIHDCPAEGYTKQFVVYDGFKDDRACEPCSCGAPEGSFCQAWMTAYADGACSSPIVAGNVWSGGSTCLDVTPPGAAVGSKLAIAAQYNAGACKPSGGTLSGEVATTGSHTVCCLA